MGGGLSNHLEMADENKFKLKLGRFVEDVMYHACIDFTQEHYIYNGNDPTITNLFKPEEIEEIEETNWKEEPEIYNPALGDETGLFRKFYSKFESITNLDTLKKKLNRKHPELCDKTHSKYWICQLYYYFLHCIFKNASKNDACFSLNLSESWILSNPWHFVQDLFHDKKDIFVVGGEKGGITSQDRKDEFQRIAGQSKMSRRLSGKKGDGYVRIFESEARDVAAIKAGPKWEGPGATKVFTEMEHVLPKVLRDIFIAMHKRLENAPHVLKTLAVPGLAIYGNKCKRLMFDHAKGYITRVTSSEWQSLYMTGAVKANTCTFLEVCLFRVVEKDTLTDFHDMVVKKKRKIATETINLGPSNPTPKKTSRKGRGASEQ
ncbi:hypothetical protein HDU80_001253 [Chytriomyces hyalinus]|nr:hypothetical protein HDU80_001253 [Chytriomyces hyalinus]